MRKRFDSTMTGQRFNHWLVIDGPEMKGRSLAYYECRCDCGKLSSVKAVNLEGGHSKQCRGCASREAVLQHGDYKTRLYRIWQAMKSRCKQEVDRRTYKSYKDKGVKVCDEWQNWLPFKEWSLRNGYSDNLEIDRRDNNGGYFPKNCRWTTRSKNMRNMSKNRILKIFGEKKCITGWSEDERCQVSRATLNSRLILGWIPERAVSQPTTAGQQVTA